MRYLGGKQRLGKHIVAVMEEIAGGLSDKTYCEPFCGMCGVGRRVRARQRVFRDLRDDLVLFLRAVRDGWTPPTEMTEEQYRAIRDGSAGALRGFAGVSGSFGGKWFGGFARGDGRNFIAEGSRDAVSLGRDIQGARIEAGDYRLMGAADVTYCDPPYAGGTQYSGLPPFDTEAFWRWARRRPGFVFVSEYNAPADVPCVWEKPHKVSLSSTCRGAGAAVLKTERLFFLDNR